MSVLLALAGVGPLSLPALDTPALADLTVTLPAWSQLVAVVVGALAGAAYAARRGFDVVGVLLLAVVQGLGGLLLRDTLLQSGRSDVLLDGRYLLGACGAAVIGFFFAGLVARLSGTLIVLDALAMGFLCSVGAGAALALSLSPSAAIFIGVVTAAGGPVLRDMVAGESPFILRPGVFVAVAAFFGATSYVLLVEQTSATYPQAQVVTVVVVFLVRILAVSRRWETTPAHDLSDRLWRMWQRPSLGEPDPVRPDGEPAP